MSIRYTLRTLKESDVNLDNLKRHELCLTDTGKVMIRLHNDTIVDLSGAAAQYATTIANEILSTGAELSDQIYEWQQLDNEAIQVFNNIYNEVKDDKDAVTILKQEVSNYYTSIQGDKVAAQTAASNAATYAQQAQTYNNQAKTYKEDTETLKSQAQSYANSAQSNASNANNSANRAAASALEASGYATSAESAKISAIGSASSAVAAKTSAETAAMNAHNSYELAREQAYNAAESETNARGSATSATNSANSAQQSATSAQDGATAAQSSAVSAYNSASSAATDAARIEAKEDTINEILEAHANVINITNEEIDDIWDDVYVPIGTGLAVDPNGVYCLPIPIPYIESLFDGG